MPPCVRNRRRLIYFLTSSSASVMIPKVGVQLLVPFHLSGPSEMVPRAREHSFAQLSLEDCSSSCNLPMAQLELPALGPGACSPTSSASAMQLVQDLGAIAHESGGLPQRFPFVCLLAELALICRYSRNAHFAHYLPHALLGPTGGVGRVLMQEQTSRLYLLEVHAAHPAQVHPPCCLLACDGRWVTFGIVDELPRAEGSAHGSAHQQRRLLCFDQSLRL